MAMLNNQRVYDMWIYLTTRVNLKTAKCCEVNDFFLLPDSQRYVLRFRLSTEDSFRAKHVMPR